MSKWVTECLYVCFERVFVYACVCVCVCVFKYLALHVHACVQTCTAHIYIYPYSCTMKTVEVTCNHELCHKTTETSSLSCHRKDCVLEISV